MIGGASGNMLIGACVDAGADFDALVRVLRTLPVQGWKIERTRVTRKGRRATYIDVVIPGEDDHHDHPDAHRHPGGRRLLEEILEIFARSELTDSQKQRACAIANALAQAEADARHVSISSAPFHPVGQIDAILDIAGTCICLDLLGVESLFCSPFPIGAKLPDETARLLHEFPSRKENVAAEMVTTTGAAILCTLVKEPGRRPLLALEREGYGAGRSDFVIPNVTRIEIGAITARSAAASSGLDPVSPPSG
jgi:uncharacterized protein (DUF111 family)